MLSDPRLVRSAALFTLTFSALACEPAAQDEYAIGHATAEARQSSEELRALPLVDGYRTPAPVAADQPASRVAFLVTLADEDASLDGVLEARGRDADGAVTPWLPVDVTFAEENLRVGRVELPELKDAVEVRLADALIDDVSEITYAAVRVPDPEAPNEAGDDDTGTVSLTDATPETQGLAVALAQAGVISRAEWGARPSGNCWSDATKQRMAIHHTASPRRASGSHLAMVRALQSYSIDGKGYCDLDYNFLVTDDGRVWEGRPLHFLAAHSGGYNGGNVGISLVGCFDASGYCDGKGGRDVPAPMMIGTASIVRTIGQMYGIPVNADRVKGHGQQPGQSTGCPGTHVLPRLDELRALANADSPAPATTHAVVDLSGYLPTSSGYTPVGPARLLDTREAGQTHTGVLGDAQSVALPVLGRAGIPSSGVEAVVLNVAVTQPASPGHVSLYPNGGAFPGTSNLNFYAGQTTANLVLVRPGSDGKVRVRHVGQGSHVIVDAFGWFPASSGYQAASPARVLDTRDGTGGRLGKLSGSVDLQLGGRGGVPSSGVAAVVVNLAVTQPNAAGYSVVWEKGLSRPETSNLNYAAGQTKANLAIVPVSASGVARLYSMQRAHYVVDVFGWFPEGGALVPVEATRLLDSREIDAPLLSESIVNVQVMATAGVPSSGVAAVVGNVTVVHPTGHGHLQVYPAGAAVPATSSLNFAPGEVVPNAFIAAVGGYGSISLRPVVAR